MVHMIEAIIRFTAHWRECSRRRRIISGQYWGECGGIRASDQGDGQGATQLRQGVARALSRSLAFLRIAGAGSIDRIGARPVALGGGDKQAIAVHCHG